MPNESFLAELARHGPDRKAAPPITAAESLRYCRNLARTHYENFTVASWLLPRALRDDFTVIYAWCRWSDDLADEIGDPARASHLLEWWRGELIACYSGRAEHPIMMALRDTIARYAIPQEPFLDLLSAFEQDQSKTRYATATELFDYCRRSANPVGRLILHLGRCHDQVLGRLSDQICTGLQWTNFCQDIARDWAAGRLYFPAEDLQRHGCSEADFAAQLATPAFRAFLAEQVDRAESMFQAGWPLVDLVPRSLRLDVELFARGGLDTLAAIRRIGYDVWRVRPVLSSWDKARLLATSWLRIRRAP